MVPSIAEEIEAYNEKCRSGGATCGLKTCPACARSPKAFKRHDERERSFRLVVETLVHTVLSFLLRWKCPLCGVTSTDYPSFALPHKRYVRQTIIESARAYVEDNDEVQAKPRPGRGTRKRRRSTYRKVASMKDGRPIAYQGADGNTPDARALSHSTIHRWVGWLGREAAAMKAAVIQRIMAVSSASTIHRLRPAIHPGKYRSETRRGLLEDAFIFFRACAEHLVRTGDAFFPDFGTREAPN